MEKRIILGGCAGILVLVLVVTGHGPLTAAQSTATPTFSMPVLPTPIPPPTLSPAARGFERVMVLEAHRGDVTGLEFSPDGTWLATMGSNDRLIKLWDVTSWEMVNEIDNATPPWGGIAFSPDGTLIASGSEVWTVPDGDLHYELGTDNSHVAFSPDGTLLATAEHNGAITVRDALTGDVLTTLPPHNHVVFNIAFSPDGTLLASASGMTNPLIKLWDTGSWELVHAFDYPEQANPPPGHYPLGDIHTVAFSPDGQWLAAGGTNLTVELWDVETGEQVDALRGLRRGVYEIAFSPDGAFLAAAGDDYVLTIWDVSERRILRQFNHLTEIRHVTFSPDGLLLVAGNADGTVMIYRTQ